MLRQVHHLCKKLPGRDLNCPVRWQYTLNPKTGFQSDLKYRTYGAKRGACYQIVYENSAPPARSSYHHIWSFILSRWALLCFNDDAHFGAKWTYCTQSGRMFIFAHWTGSLLVCFWAHIPWWGYEIERIDAVKSPDCIILVRRPLWILQPAWSSNRIIADSNAFTASEPSSTGLIQAYVVQRYNFWHCGFITKPGFSLWSAHLRWNGLESNQSLNQ